MSKLKSVTLVTIFLLSTLAGCISSEEEEKDEEEEETKIDDSREEVFAACSGGIANISECNVESVYGVDLSPLAPIEFAVHEHSVDEGHTPSGVKTNETTELHPPEFPDMIGSMGTSTSGRSCSSADLGGLNAEELVEYLVASTDSCIYYFWTFNSEVGAVMTDANMQYIADELITLSENYQGDNTQGIHQLLFFLRVSWYQEYYQSSVSFQPVTFDATYLAATALKESIHVLDEGDEARKILRQLVILADTADFAHTFIPLFQTVLDTFIVQSTMDHYYSGSTVYSVLYAISRTVDRPEFNAHEGLLDLLERVAEISVDTGDILIPNDDVWTVNWAIWTLARIAYTDAPVLYDLGCEYVVAAENHHYDESDYNLPLLWALNVHESFYGADCINPEGQYSLDGLLSGIEAQLFPNVFYYDNGRIEIKTSLEIDEIEPLYYAVKEVASQFFRLSESKQPVTNDPNYRLTMIIYGTKEDYRQYQPLLYGTSSNNGGIYIEQWGKFFTFQREPSESIYTLEELVKHEYSHYLVGRHLVHGNWGDGEFYDENRLTWFNEGLAEYLAGSTNRDGVELRQIIMQLINNDGASRLSVSQITESSYNSGFKYYRYANLLIDFLIQNQDITVRNMMECIYLNDVDCYDNEVEQLLLQPNLEADYQAHIDEMLLLLSTYGPAEVEYHPVEQLDLVEPEYMENRIRESRYGYDAECDMNIRTTLTRFRCIGTLHHNSSEYDTTIKSWSDFNIQLDDLMRSIATNSGDDCFDCDLENLDDAVCWFDRILIEPNIRQTYDHTTKYHCEVPLPTGDYPVESTITEQMLEDISRTRANSTIECVDQSTNTIQVLNCEIGVESQWFEIDTEESVIIANLLEYAREISNQIHASSPVKYGRQTCDVIDEYQYQDLEDDMIYASSTMKCTWIVN
jgi:microbial collagenase